ncbi:MAG TPA: TonB-dependent receptor, partial [Vicinamibacteria bacterium]|nr:TonB-dependent receptor [Vicinamibacteria bacterium]
IVIVDPSTGLPFPGNIIPPGMLNPVGVAYLNAFPLPDITTRAQQNFFTHRVRTSKYNDFDGRFDQTLSSQDTVFLRGSYWNDGFSDPGRIPGFQAGFGSGSSDNKGYLIGAGETHTFASNVVNELRLGFVNFHYDFLPVGFGTNQNQALGIPGPGGITTANGISLIGGGNGGYIEYLGDFGQYIVNQKSLEFSDALSWIKGSHSMKFGATAIRRDLNFQRTNFGKGFYSFSDSVGTPGASISLGQTGYEVANMLLGATSFTATGVPGYVPREDINWETSVFAQDDWRVNQKLTLNLGLRYDVFFPYYEAKDQLANFDPTTGTLVLPNQNGVPRSTLNTDYGDIGPRLGFAYILNEKTVLRGGYGIFYTLDRGGVD